MKPTYIIPFLLFLTFLSSCDDTWITHIENETGVPITIEVTVDSSQVSLVDSRIENRNYDENDSNTHMSCFKSVYIQGEYGEGFSGALVNSRRECTIMEYDSTRVEYTKSQFKKLYTIVLDTIENGQITAKFDLRTKKKLQIASCFLCERKSDFEEITIYWKSLNHQENKIVIKGEYAFETLAKEADDGFVITIK